MKYDEKIMYDVFKKFLEHRPMNLKDNNDLKSFANKLVDDLPYEINLIRRHVTILIDEFLISPTTIETFYGKWRFEDPADHFNWSGQELYDSLKEKYDDKIK